MMDDCRKKKSRETRTLLKFQSIFHFSLSFNSKIKNKKKDEAWNPEGDPTSIYPFCFRLLFFVGVPFRISFK